MTHRTNPIVVVKEVDLDISHIYSHNHIVGMDKIFSSDRYYFIIFAHILLKFCDIGSL
jgi:hypothetical protein